MMGANEVMRMLVFTGQGGFSPCTVTDHFSGTVGELCVRRRKVVLILKRKGYFVQF